MYFICLPPSARRRSASAAISHSRVASSAGHGANDPEWLFPCRDLVGERIVRRIVGYIMLASEEPHHRPTLERAMIANRAAQHGICLLYTSDAADDLTRVDLGGG